MLAVAQTALVYALVTVEMLLLVALVAPTGGDSGETINAPAASAEVGR